MTNSREELRQAIRAIIGQEPQIPEGLGTATEVNLYAGIQQRHRNITSQLVDLFEDYARTREKKAVREELASVLSTHDEVCGATIPQNPRDDCMLLHFIKDRIAQLSQEEGSKEAPADSASSDRRDLIADMCPHPVIDEKWDREAEVHFCGLCGDVVPGEDEE